MVLWDDLPSGYLAYGEWEWPITFDDKDDDLRITHGDFP